MWAKKKGFVRKAGGDVQPPASNLHLTGFLGGVLCVPDDEYGAFLEEYAKDIQFGSRQFFTECRGEEFRLYFDLDIVQAAQMSDSDIDSILAACHAAVRQFLPDSSLLRCIVSTADPSTTDKGVKTGVHIAMPHVIVDRERALDARAAFVSELKSAFEGTTFAEWSEACDASVYSNSKSGLRMLGSRKMRPCPVCHNHSKDRESCTACAYRGKEDIGRPYSVYAVYEEGVRDDSLTGKYKSNFLLSLRHSSIRVAAADRNQPHFLTSKWARFVGCPIMPPSAPSHSEKQAISGHMGKRKASETTEFDDDKKMTAKFCRNQQMTTLARGDKRVNVMVSALGRLHPKYASLECGQAICFPELNTYLLKVRGHGQNFCLNKMDDHNTATVYFYFQSSSGGSFQQRCFSTKETTNRRLDGQCRCFKSQSKRLDKDEFKALWPNFEAKKSHAKM